jgi:hemoglobin-like flavoprotein
MDNVNLFKHITGFSDKDSAAVQAISPLLTAIAPKLTDEFYAQLLSHPETKKHIDGRVDTLKATHQEWIVYLFTGPHDEAFFARQEIIGVVHVKVKIPPLFVSSSMSFLRHAIVHLLHMKAESGELTCEEFEHASAGILRLLDLCQMLIDNAYEVERLRLLSEATGMKLKLIENLISLK